MNRKCLWRRGVLRRWWLLLGTWRRRMRMRRQVFFSPILRIGNRMGLFDRTLVRRIHLRLRSSRGDGGIWLARRMVTVRNRIVIGFLHYTAECDGARRLRFVSSSLEIFWIFFEVLWILRIESNGWDKKKFYQRLRSSDQLRDPPSETESLYTVLLSLLLLNSSTGSGFRSNFRVFGFNPNCVCSWIRIVIIQIRILLDIITQ